MKKLPNTEKGFSLIEMLVVIAIIGILAAIAVPKYQQYLAKARNEEAINLGKAVETLEEGWRSDHRHNSYECTFATLDTTGQIAADLALDTGRWADSGVTNSNLSGCGGTAWQWDVDDGGVGSLAPCQTGVHNVLFNQGGPAATNWDIPGCTI